MSRRNSKMKEEVDENDQYVQLNIVGQESEKTASDKTDDVVHNKEEFDGATKLPVDTGWAWVICLSAYVVTWVMSLYDVVLAVTFVDVMDRFEVIMTTATVVFTVFAISQSLGSVVSTNVLIPRYGDRSVIVLASVINSLMTIVIAFSPKNIYFFHAMHGIKGFSVGSMWIPALGLLGHYFKRRRSLATALCNTGIGVALLSCPPIVRFFMETYGFRGTLLLVSAMEMHAIAAAMLLRPVASYGKRKIIHSNGTILTNAYEMIVYVTADNKIMYSEPDETKQNMLVKSDHTTDRESVKPDGNIPADDSKNIDHSLHDGNNSISAHLNDKSETIENYCEKNSAIHNSLTFQTKDDYELQSPSSYLLEQYNQEQKCLVSVPLNSKEDPGTVQCKDLSISNHNSSTQCADEKTTIDISDQKQCKKEHDCSSMFCSQRLAMGLSYVDSFFGTGFVSDWLFRLLLTSTAFGVLVLYIPAYIPTLAVKRGVDKSSAAFLLTICGGVNLFSLLFQGLIVDCRVISAAKFVAIAQIVVGTMCHLVHFFTTFPTLVLLSVTYGMFGGARMSFMPVVAIDYMGVENLSRTLGFNAMVATISMSLHHPILGYILDKAGTFTVPFHYVGLALYVSSLLMFLEKFCRSLNARRKVK